MYKYLAVKLEKDFYLFYKKSMRQILTISCLCFAQIRVG